MTKHTKASQTPRMPALTGMAEIAARILGTPEADETTPDTPEQPLTLDQLEAQYDRQIQALGALTAAKAAAKKAGASREAMTLFNSAWVEAQDECDATLEAIERARKAAGLLDEQP